MKIFIGLILFLLINSVYSEPQTSLTKTSVFRSFIQVKNELKERVMSKVSKELYKNKSSFKFQTTVDKIFDQFD
jgi:hypothetical protein